MEKWTIEKINSLAQKNSNRSSAFIKVGLSSCGIAAGAQEVFDVLASEVTKRSMPLKVLRCGCSGMCYAEPLVEVSIDGLPPVTYGNVTPQIAVQILDNHVEEKRLVNDHIVEMMLRKQE
jgi:(2Fe-2S) ferredoxin